MTEQFKIFGIDFTSKPSKKKPITCLECLLEGNILTSIGMHRWVIFDEFEKALNQPGNWIMGLDFPFTQSYRFIKNIGWPNEWGRYMDEIKDISRDDFRKLLDDYRKKRPYGDKEHKRKCDIESGALSPQKIYGTPVGLMFFEGAQRLKRSNVTIPFIKNGDPNQIAVEAYPGILIRNLIGRQPYKTENLKTNSNELLLNRKKILKLIMNDALFLKYDLHVEVSENLIDDPSGDELDAFLCAIQAAWAIRQFKVKKNVFCDKSTMREGWIADPNLF